MQNQFTAASSGATPRPSRLIVSDFNGTLEFADKSINNPAIRILRKALNAGDRVVCATGESVPRMQAILKPLFDPQEFAKIEFHDKKDLITVLQQTPGSARPDVPDLVFDDTASVDSSARDGYLNDYKQHARILTPDFVTLGPKGGRGVLSSYEEIEQTLQLDQFPEPSPIVPSAPAPGASGPASP